MTKKTHGGKKPRYKIILSGQPLDFFNSANPILQAEMLLAFQQLQRNPRSGKNIERWNGTKWVKTASPKKRLNKEKK